MSPACCTTAHTTSRVPSIIQRIFFQGSVTAIKEEIESGAFFTSYFMLGDDMVAVLYALDGDHGID